MRLPQIRTRWLVAGGIGIGAVLLLAVGLGVIYPRVGAWMIRNKLDDKIGKRLGRDVTVGNIDVSIGHATLHDLEIRGPLDGELPFVHVDRIDIDFDGWSSLIGRVELGAAQVQGVIVTVRRQSDGRDNVRDAIDRLTAERSGGGTSSGGGMRPTSVTVTRIKLLADDQMSGATALVDDGDATWTRDGLVAHIRGLTTTTSAAPKATVADIEIRKAPGVTPVIKVNSGELELWPKMALSGIGGVVVANPDKPGHYVIDLAGGYGGVPGKLWTAKGDLDPKALTMSVDLEAEKFQLDRLAPILERSAIVDYKTSSVDTKLNVVADRAGARFSGQFHLNGFNLGHPRIAEKEVRNLDMSGKIAGTFDRATRRLELTQGDFVVRNIPFSVTGVAIDPRAVIREFTSKATEPTTEPGKRVLEARLVIPPVDCQRFLTAIPTEVAPAMAGYRLRGVFDVDLRMAIDWSTLDTLVLDGHVGINHCKVKDEPADSPKRLIEEFEHYVEVEQGEWISFIVGPTNPDFVPLDQISPYLLKSIMSTEDSAFYDHHGFITSEFRTALLNDLKAHDFKQGASSITMQMVKNVLLYRDKTLARKLQELFLTWHVEEVLEKDRIFEIYLNVIEYGPGLYGIGPAARHFFGKPAKDLNATEAAFFSSILPSPKERYKQYCQGTLTKWTTAKIERILQTMMKRNRLTQAEYDQAIATPLLFVKDGLETEEDCLKRVKKAIKNARPTDPLKQKPDPSPSSHKKKKSSSRR